MRVAGAHDAMGAKLAVHAGMDAIWSSGFEISSAHAVPDASILTMSDYLAVAQRIAQAVAPVPVLADCDTGYGNSNNVIHMVRQFEAAGVAAVCIEDKKFPKTNSFIPGKQELASIAEFCGKLLAAKNAQRTTAFAVIARTEALIAGWGVDEALRRADAYVRAGADALLIHDKSLTGDAIREFLARWSKPVPVIVVPTTFPALTVAAAEAIGIKTVIYANQGIRASARAIAEVWNTIVRDGSSVNVESSIAPLAALFELQGMPAHTAAEREFDRAGTAPTRAIILHAGDHGDDSSLAPLTADVPLAALDINGMPLVQRQIAMLQRCGVQDITVVTGYRHEGVPANGARQVVNAAWKTGGEVGSLLAAPAAAASPDVRTLICYGDVLVEPQLLERLLGVDEACTIVVDRSDRGSRATAGPDGARAAHVVRDPVIVADEGADDGSASRRFLSPPHPRRVVAIGRAAGAAAPTGAAQPNGEFAGLVLVSAAHWPKLHARAAARTAGTASALPDWLGDALADGDTVTCLEVTSGWLELRTFADYQLACRMVGS